MKRVPDEDVKGPGQSWLVEATVALCWAIDYGEKRFMRAESD